MSDRVRIFIYTSTLWVHKGVIVTLKCFTAEAYHVYFHILFVVVLCILVGTKVEFLIQWILDYFIECSLYRVMHSLNSLCFSIFLMGKPTIYLFTKTYFNQIHFVFTIMICGYFLKIRTRNGLLGKDISKLICGEHGTVRWTLRTLTHTTISRNAYNHDRLTHHCSRRTIFKIHRNIEYVSMH